LGRFILVAVLLACAVVVVSTPQVRERLGNLLTAASEDVAPQKDELGGHKKVWVLRGGKYYHRRDCPRLEGTSSMMMLLPQAKDLYKPCPTCVPPQ
jgi:hypothetical protein